MIAVGAIAGFAPAAEAGWQAPESLSSAADEGHIPQVALNRAGAAAAVWDYGTVFQPDTAPKRVQGAAAVAGGSFSAPADLSADSPFGRFPQVAIDQAGGAVAVWQSYGNFGVSVAQASIRPPGGAFSAPINLSSGGTAYGPQVAIDSAGTAVVIWNHDNGNSTSTIQMATRPANGSFSGPVDISPPISGIDQLQLAMNSAGRIVIAWSHVISQFSYTVQAITRPAGGAFSAPVDIGAVAGFVLGLHVAAGEDGSAIATWDAAAAADGVYAAVQPAGGSFAPPVTLSSSSTSTDGPRAAIDQAGDATVIWENVVGATGVVRAATRPAGGSFSAPVDVSIPAQETGGVPVLALDPAGNAVAVWTRFNGENQILQAATRPVGGTFTSATDLAPLGADVDPDAGAYEPQVAMDASGDAIAIWSQQVGGDRIIKAARLDDPFPPVVPVVTPPLSLPQPRVVPPARPAPPAPALASLSGLHAAPSAFHAAKSGPSTSTAVMRGRSRVSYTLNTAASVRFTVERRLSGRRVGTRCVKSSLSTRHRKSCTRFVRQRGSVTRQRPAGKDLFTFTGRFGGRTLAAGRYRLLAAPTANKRTGATRRASFSIKR